MHFNYKTVRSDSGRRDGDRVDHPRMPRGVRRIDNDRKMGKSVQKRNYAEIERISQGGLKRPDAALAENHVRIARGDDVFGAHQKFLNRRRHSSLQEDRLLGVCSDLLEKVEVLHVSRANLDDVDIIEAFDILEIHKLGDDRKPGFFLRCIKKSYSFFSKPLERIGRSARLERAAPKHRGARLLDGLGAADYLLFGLYRTGPRNHREGTAADLDARTVDYGIFRMEFAVGGFVRLLNTLNGLNDIESLNKPRIYVGNIADAPDNRLELTGRYMRLDVVGLENFLQRFKL